MARLQQQALDFGWDALKDIAAFAQYPFVSEENFLRGAGSFEGAQYHLDEIEKLREPMGRGEYPLIEDALMAAMSKVPEPVLETLGDPRMEYGLSYYPAIGGLFNMGIRQALKRIPDSHGVKTPDPSTASMQGEAGMIRMFEGTEADRFFNQNRMDEARYPSYGSRQQLVQMEPGEFLSLAAPLASPSSYKMTGIADAILSDTPLEGIPHLWFENMLDEGARVMGHEGRHRAHTFQNLGIEEMPVVLHSMESGTGPAIRWQKQHANSPDLIHPDDWPRVIRGEQGNVRNELPFIDFYGDSGGTRYDRIDAVSPMEQRLATANEFDFIFDEDPDFIGGNSWFDPDDERLTRIERISSQGQVNPIIDRLLSEYSSKQRGAINMFDAADIIPRRFDTVSTRIPSEAAQRKQGINAHTTDALLVNAGLLSPEKFEQAVDAMRQYAPFRNLGDDPQEAFGEMRTLMADNLRWMYDIMPEKWRDKAQDWYLGYNRIAQQAARDHNTSNEQAAAVMAVFSPNTEWNLNLTRADRLMDTYNLHQNTKWTPEMSTVANQLANSKTLSKKYRDATKQAMNKQLSQLQTPAEKAMWIEIYDKAHNPREYYTYAPDGSRDKMAVKKDGSPKEANWVYRGHAEKAIKILEDGSMENISRQLGDEHKVRSFFHNAADPWHPDTTTVDTHAVAGDLLLPMGSSIGTPWTEVYNMPVSHNFGRGGMRDVGNTGMRGTYPFHQAAFNQAASELGIPSRQLQSPTWDFGRLMFEGQKTKNKQKYAEDVWEQVGRGEISAQKARDMIVEAFGMPVSPYR